MNEVIIEALVCITSFLFFCPYFFFSTEERMRDPQAIVNACAIFEDTVLNQRGKYLGTRSSSGNSFGTDLDEPSSNDESKSECLIPSFPSSVFSSF